MTTLLYDADGREVVTAETLPDRCPNCGAPTKDIEVTPPGFGGYWSAICRKCEHVLARGRG